ncbi:MAG: DUF819 family protein [Acidobacteriota bacterium]
MHSTPLITNDAVVLGLLSLILAFVFTTSNSGKPGWKKFYTFFPSVLACYFIPSVFSTLGVISAEESNLYYVSSRYLLPASLVLLTLSTDIPGILRLGPKALIMFLTGTFGIVVGGPLALLIFAWISPDLIGVDGPDAVWRGMTTVAGSWIGGGANQAAMKEVFGVGDRIFSVWVAVDVIVANVWMACLLIAAGREKQIDQRTGADSSAIEDLKRRISDYQAGIAKIPTVTETIQIVAIGVGVTGFAHFCADRIAPWLAENAPALERFSLTSTFFWIVVVATTIGLILSGTRFRALEGAGASRIGTVFLYFLIASIGMHMDLKAIFAYPQLFAVGALWMVIHATLMIVVAKIIKAPIFLMAVGSQANVGGAASAPVVASAFHPSLATVGVLLAVFGYTLGTYAAWLCGQVLRVIAGA